MVIVMKNWLLGASALFGFILIAGRAIHYAISASDLGLILLMTHGIRYLVNGLNAATSAAWFTATSSLIIGAVAFLLGVGGLWFGLYHSKKA